MGSTALEKPARFAPATVTTYTPVERTDRGFRAKHTVLYHGAEGRGRISTIFQSKSNVSQPGHLKAGKAHRETGPIRCGAHHADLALGTGAEIGDAQ